MHADLGPAFPPAFFLGGILTGLGQEVRLPVPEGGAGQLTARGQPADRARRRVAMPRRRQPAIEGRDRTRRSVFVPFSYSCETISKGIKEKIVPAVFSPPTFALPSLYTQPDLLFLLIPFFFSFFSYLDRFQYYPATFKVRLGASCRRISSCVPSRRLGRAPSTCATAWTSFPLFRPTSLHDRIPHPFLILPRGPMQQGLIRRASRRPRYGLCAYPHLPRIFGAGRFLLRPPLSVFLLSSFYSFLLPCRGRIRE